MKLHDDGEVPYPALVVKACVLFVDGPCVNRSLPLLKVGAMRRDVQIGNLVDLI